MIEVNWVTGERGGGQISIEDIRAGKLVSLGSILHQRLDTEPEGNFELRIVKDDRDITKYKGKIILDDGTEVTSVKEIPEGRRIVDVKGVVPLMDKDEINKAIKLAFVPKYYGRWENVVAWVQENAPELFIYANDMYEFYKRAYEKGCPYIRKVEPPTL